MFGLAILFGCVFGFALGLIGGGGGIFAVPLLVDGLAVAPREAVVRSNEEWKEGHIEQAEHRFLGRLPKHLSEPPSDEKLVVQCRSGARSAIAASVLQAAGLKNVVNLTGGYAAWKSAANSSGRACCEGVCSSESPLNKYE